MNAVGIVFSNIHDNDIAELTFNRTMGSIPFGGRYRLIDFTLSNMVNSGISKVGVITKNNYQSLMDHLGSGKDWDLARKGGGLIILPPYGAHDSGLYITRLQALKGIGGFLRRCEEEFVIMTDCDAVCNIDFNDILDFHKSKHADITLICKKIKKSVKMKALCQLETSKTGRVTDLNFAEKADENANVFVNIYFMKKVFLQHILQDAVAHNYQSFNRDCLLKNVNNYKIYAYTYGGYFEIVNSLANYYKLSMELLNDKNRAQIFGGRSIYTKVRDSAPTKYSQSAVVSDSFIADGCQIDGEVVNSVIFRGVKVSRGALVKNSIIMQDSVVGENANLNAVILDKSVVIKDRRILSGCEELPYFVAKGSLI